MKKTIQHIDIKNFLPHRAPMLMVDKMLSVDEIAVETNFKINSSCIFVKEDYLRESGIIEHMAQTCSAIVGKSYFDDEDLEGEGNDLIGFISAIKSVNILKLPKIGDIINTNAHLISRFDGEGYSICTMSCEMEVDNSQYANCKMNLFIQEV